ncbi:MAG: hypothetical protein U0R19_13170 [Bryobacteraceae bacterium]
MNTKRNIITLGLILGNLLGAQTITTIITTTTAATPLVYPNCTTPNFAVPAKPKDTKRFVTGDQVKDSARKEIPTKEPVSAVYDGATIWVLTTGQEIVRLDPATTKPIESHYIPDASSFLLDGDNIWVGTTKAQLHRYSRSLRKVTLTVTLGTGSVIKGATDGTNIVALSNGLVQLSATTFWKGMMTTVRPDGTYLTVGLSQSATTTQPEPVSFTLESGYAWIARADGTILQVPVLPNGETQKKHDVDTDSGGIVDSVSDGASVWIVNSGTGSVSRFDLQSKTLVSKIPGAPGAKKLLFDGTSLWVATTDRIVQFHGTDSRKLNELQIGTKPTALLFDGMKVWQADRLAGTLKQVQ